MSDEMRICVIKAKVRKVSGRKMENVWQKDGKCFTSAPNTVEFSNSTVLYCVIILCILYSACVAQTGSRRKSTKLYSTVYSRVLSVLYPQPLAMS